MADNSHTIPGTLGIDFGTSNSAAAWRTPDGEGMGSGGGMGDGTGHDPGTSILPIRGRSSAGLTL